MATRVGKLVQVPNRKKKFNANEYYLSSWLKLPSGRIVPVLFTEDDIAQAQYRAKNNPEDVAGRSLTSLVLD